MENQKLDLNDHSKILEDLDKLEEKLQFIINFYEELGILRQRRKYLVETFIHRDLIKLEQEKLTLKKQEMFKPGDFRKDKRSAFNIKDVLEKKKSIAQVYDLLENLSTYHEEVDKRISDLRLLKSHNKSDPEFKEFDTILTQLQAEKDEIDNKIIQFVFKNVFEGKDELFHIISLLEEDKENMLERINLLEGRVNFLKDTVTALMIENQLLKKEEMRHSNVIRQSVVAKVSLLFPSSLRKSSVELEDWSTDMLGFPIKVEQEDILSVEKSTFDSFNLDTALAFWSTDDASIQEHVRRIGRDLEVMEVNQMKLNLLKSYVQKHGAKYINMNSLIDPTRGKWSSM